MQAEKVNNIFAEILNFLIDRTRPHIWLHDISAFSSLLLKSLHLRLLHLVASLFSSRKVLDLLR